MNFIKYTYTEYKIKFSLQLLTRNDIPNVPENLNNSTFKNKDKIEDKKCPCIFFTILENKFSA